MLATVDALLPLSLLEAVRDVDTPAGVLEAEFVDELRNKRFGLSDTVYTQIKRYTEAVRRNHRPAQDEVIALARLIGRRPDAEAVLRAAGRYLAHEAYMTVPAVSRAMIRALPAFVSRPMALRKVARPEDVAAQVVILSSDVLSGHVTGQLVTVAGGMEGRTLHER